MCSVAGMTSRKAIGECQPTWISSTDMAKKFGVAKRTILSWVSKYRLMIIRESGPKGKVWIHKESVKFMIEVKRE